MFKVVNGSGNSNDTKFLDKQGNELQLGITRCEIVLEYNQVVKAVCDIELMEMETEAGMVQYRVYANGKFHIIKGIVLEDDCIILLPQE